MSKRNLEGESDEYDHQFFLAVLKLLIRESLGYWKTFELYK